MRVLLDFGRDLAAVGPADPAIGRVRAAGDEGERPVLQLVARRQVAQEPRILPGPRLGAPVTPVLLKIAEAVANDGGVLRVLHGDGDRLAAVAVDHDRHSLPVGLVVEARSAGQGQPDATRRALPDVGRVVVEVPPVVEEDELSLADLYFAWM